MEAGKALGMENPFVDALQSEIVAGSEGLTGWLGQIQRMGRIESLFGLETWLKGIRAFFNLEHLPLSDSERSALITRSFAPEIAIALQAIRLCESFAGELIDRGVGQRSAGGFPETRNRRDRMQDGISHPAGQLTPADGISQLLDSLNDLRVTINSLQPQPGRDFQLFVTLGRAFAREIKNCRYIDLLVSQRFKSQYDSIDSKAFIAALRRIPHEPVRRNTALVFLFLFRFLKYLKSVLLDLNRDRPLKQHLVIFSLIHEEMGSLMEMIRARLLRSSEVGSALQNAAELVSYSLKTESQRVQTRELTGVSHEMDPRVVYSRVENSHGLLRNCCQSCILTLIQSVDKSFDPTVLFPSRAGQLVAAEKLRQDLWNLRRWLMDILANKDATDCSRIIERIGAFKEASVGSLMYRDWAEFEAFTDTVAVSINPAEIRTQLRKFVSYLETLIQEVSKRSVFRENQENQDL